MISVVVFFLFVSFSFFVCDGGSGGRKCIKVFHAFFINEL